ncbi:hypothetical protein [Saccharopolyspora pogona]|uniref:hypothetical protein n=1 Tax=Saccharopolyspora pogona TaxID=333966 RepID=UPI00168A23E0|nr:hypothetical protein [Saccharopolyspora pogona]
MAERKLTAEERAAQDAAEPATQAPATTKTTSGTVRLAPPPFVAEFRVGDTLITEAGVELDAKTADQVREAAARSGIQLREL